MAFCITYFFPAATVCWYSFTSFKYYFIFLKSLRIFKSWTNDSMCSSCFLRVFFSLKLFYRYILHSMS